jgi:hypothetical protein
MTKKHFSTGLKKGLALNKINWDIPENHFPSLNNCNVCRMNSQKVICEKMTEFSGYTADQKIAFISDIIHQKSLIKSLFNENDIEFYELMRNIELENLKQEQLTTKETLKTRSVIELLEILGLKKINAKGTNREIGIEFGKFFFHTKNSNKELMFNIEAVDLATLVEVMIEASEGKGVKHHTMEGYIGEGRNN